MSVRVRRLASDDAAGLEDALRRRPRLPFTKGFGLDSEGSLRWFDKLFQGADCALVAERDGRIEGGLAMDERPWESGIYGVAMARVACVFAAEREVAAALLDACEEVCDELAVEHNSALVFAEDTAVVHAFGDAGWRLVDSTLDFTWACGQTTPGEIDPDVTLRESVDVDRAPLAALCREAYTRTIQTRFSADPWLPIEKTGELYARWFELACDGEFGDVVVVAECDGKPVGFNTFKLDAALSEATGLGFAMHGIAAVDPAYRGRATQPSMLHWLAEWQRARGGSFNRGRVLLQNQPMQRACARSGAYVTQGFHTFHKLRGA